MKKIIVGAFTVEASEDGFPMQYSIQFLNNINEKMVFYNKDIEDLIYALKRIQD